MGTLVEDTCNILVGFNGDTQITVVDRAVQLLHKWPLIAHAPMYMYNLLHANTYIGACAVQLLHKWPLIAHAPMYVFACSKLYWLIVHTSGQWLAENVIQK